MRAVLVPPLVPSGVSPLASACLISSPYASTLCPAISSSRAWLRAVPLCVPRLVPLLASPRHRCRCLCRCRPMASRLSAPPHRHDGRGDTIALRRFSALLACPSARHPISAVRHRMATRFSACLVRLPPACSRPMAIIGADCYPLARPIRFPRRPVVLPPHHLIAFPPRSLDTGDGARSLGLGCLLVGSFVIAVRFALRAICAGSVEDGVGGCLACLGIVLCICRWGMWSRDGACPAFDLLGRARHPLLFPSPVSTHIAVPGFSSSFHCPGTCRFSFDALCPVRLLTMADGARCFYAYHSGDELVKTARAVSRFQFNRFGSAVLRCSLIPSASVPLRVRRVSLPF